MDFNPADFELRHGFESGLQRVKWFSRQLVTMQDMKDEQNYHREKRKNHNRLLHGWGTVCGLEVTAAPTAANPWQVEIGLGYALDPCGEEIYVADGFTLDLAQCGPGAATDPCEPGLLRAPAPTTGNQTIVAIKYAECLAQPVLAMPAGCACEDENCEYSRIREGFEIGCLTELPPSHQPLPGPTLCDLVTGQALPVCPPCPADPWVVLAQVNLPASPATDIVQENIDPTVRRMLYPVWMLQEQLINCCCRQEDADLRVTQSITPVATAPNLNIRSETEVSNLGPAVAHNIILTISINITGGNIIEVSNFETNRGEWTSTEFPGVTPSVEFVAQIPQLAPLESATLTFNEVIREPEATVVNTANVSSDTPDHNLTNNSATDTFPRPPITPPGGPIIDGP